ncbi:transcriptional regulator [Bradyrhizobium sp. SSBR45G]|uniref:MarR family winged helix-turn-helix transcriptional regulator n=1 Tax=unclassified Bradyrhizobium TaxID=2631580 RepID=UPI002342AD48|nr:MULTISPECIES: MarR family transcriptional regulator [unclassified Bradyrhizobium]GLH75311.1 transcriptional regulator [Bradyrhizobium sp. SSBR45G]GLH82902.1 transcriptional regulator [Bradyrhizobium sp. SSBR45R]
MRKTASRSTPRRPPSRPAPTTARAARSRSPSGTNAAPASAPLPGEGKRGEDGHLAYLLRQAQAAARLSLDRALTSTGLTHPQFVVLTMLKAYPGLSGADCARIALLTPQTVNVIIANLERDGAIRKTPHPVHGRVLQWNLTRHGLALLARARLKAAAVERRLAGSLGKRELVTVRRWLAQVAAEFHQD